MSFAQTRIRPEEWNVQNSLGFWDIKRLSNANQKKSLNDNKKKKKTCWIVDFGIPEEQGLKIKKKNKKNLNRASKLKKLSNMKVTVIPTLIGALGTISWGLLKGLEELEIEIRIETIQTTAVIWSARILRGVLVTWGDWLSLWHQKKTTS